MVSFHLTSSVLALLWLNHADAFTPRGLERRSPSALPMVGVMFVMALVFQLEQESNLWAARIQGPEGFNGTSPWPT